MTDVARSKELDRVAAHIASIIFCKQDKPMTRIHRVAAWHLRALRAAKKPQPFKDQFRDESPPRRKR